MDLQGIDFDEVVYETSLNPFLFETELSMVCGFNNSLSNV